MERVERATPMPVAAGKGANETQPIRTRKHNKRPTKINRILSILASGQSLNRFEAFRYSDTCLHSTVSAIQQKYGIEVLRRFEVVRGYQGAPTTVCRYWLAADELTKARQLLAKLDGGGD